MIFLLGSVMKKENVFLRTILSTVMTAIGLSSPVLAEDEPAVERDTVLMSPLYFEKDGAPVTDESENQKLWNDLMKYKLWGTQSIIFNKHAFRIKETSGYTGTAVGDIVFNDYGHTLGGPIVSGQDLLMAYDNGSAEIDSLIGGSIYARNLYLRDNYQVENSRFDGNICFEGDIIFNTPRKTGGESWEYNEYINVLNRFIENAHRKVENDVTRKEGKVYADWRNGLTDPAVLNLDGSFADCPEDVPQPDRNLSVPLIKDITKLDPAKTWEPAINVSSGFGKIVFVHVPPITNADLEQSPKKVWYDKYVENLIAGGSTGQIIYILMPSNKWNANKKTGRLTRIFSRDGFNFQGSANDLRIQVAIVNDNATWNENTQMWENLNGPDYDVDGKTIESEDKPYWIQESGWHNLDKLNINPVADSNYAGNLLFYTTVDVSWVAMVNIDYQGTFMTAGNFTIEDHLNIAGQLIAGKTLKFESDVNGEFHYVPFNSPEVKADIFASDKFKENNDVWYSMDFYLTDTARTEVSFDYCFAFFGVDVDTTGGKYNGYKSIAGAFAEPKDLALSENPTNVNDPHFMPFCKDGQKKHIVIKKGQRKPDIPAYIKVIQEGHQDGVVEGDEWMLFKIMNMNGASIVGGRFDGGIPVKLIDTDNKPPHFIGVDKTNLAVLENKTKASAGKINAKDDEGDNFTYEITGGTAKDLFEINSQTGDVTMKNGVEPFDYEEWITSNTSYTLKVEICDKKAISFNTLLCSQATFKVSVTDVNEKPVFVEKNKTFTFPENAKGYVIDTLHFEDEDLAAKFRSNKFKIENEVNGFYLDPTTGVLTTTRKFDYETEDKTYELHIRVYDVSGDTALVDTGTIFVNLLNVNEPPYLTETVFTVLESEPIGTALKDVLEATDVDGPDIVFHFHILDGTKEVDATKEFKLDSKTGAFTVASALDYETTESYSIRIRVRDEHDGFSDTTVTINVFDVNEAPSVIVDTIYVLESQVIREPFGTVKTNRDDPDTKNPDFRNNVYENIDTNKFIYVKSNGDAVLLKPVDYEADSIYVITVRVTDKDDNTLTSTKDVVVKVLDVYEKSNVVITRVETKDSIYLRPDSVFVNVPEVDVEWTTDDKPNSSTEPLKPGCNVITKTYKDPTKNAAGSASVVVCYSDAAPIVTVSANGEDVKADNIYTVVEKATKNDTAIYVNDKKNDIKVTVKDTSSKFSKTFTVKLELDTISVPSKEFKNIKTVADSKLTRKKNPSSRIITVRENDSYNKNTYTDEVNGIPVTITYYTDKSGNDVKRSVITSSGKTEEIAIIEVSYTAKIDGKEVKLSYFADASTGERVSLETGLNDSESVLSADGDDVIGAYKVYYTYTDKNGNAVDVSYFLDEKGKIAKNDEGNIAYNVGYTYVNKFGNSSREEVLVVFDQVSPVVKIETPSDESVLTGNFTEVIWTVNGVKQDTLKVQGLENGVNTIVRVFRDKAGNEARDSVHVMVKNAKDIEIAVEKPVTKVDRDSVKKYYKKNPPGKHQDYSVTILNQNTGREKEIISGVNGKAKEGSGEEPYPNSEGSHLGPTLKVDARVPVVNAVGGLATLDDIVSASGMVALEGVDAANGKKISVEEYVDKYCTDEFKTSMKSTDYAHMNLYWTKLKVKIWVFTNTGEFADFFSFNYDLDDPDYVTNAGLLKFYFELKPDANGDIKTKDGRLYGTGAYLFKTDVKMTSKLRCDLPPISDDKQSKKKNAVIRTSDELLKAFGYRRPVDK